MSDVQLTTGEIHTAKGVLKFELYDDDAPIAAANFKKLVSEGFYNGLTFHRVIPNFMIQGGCPDGTGAGGPGYTINCELNGTKQIHDRGVLSMAHRGRNTGGSQFFICHNRSGVQHLDGVHTCFGKITEGLEIIDEIRGGDVMEKVMIN
ncbi:peptidylprolyl isomerase [Ferruginibacter sp.]|uniref:peptidylprolyl isomerase n=1 Tax=Ferruginibacter sp. TaxID=1940288 RepID=UPI0019A20762|nr:peptidylprolyl isomerase [Ferruginibacter sp.]MBC7626592.1 peptidylprolyl isomerase [Ferruginibacter sp.]